MSDIDLDAIEARANAATPGPWHVVEIDPDGRWGIQPDNGDSSNNGPTARFVAAARTDIPALIARVREQEQEIARLNDLVKEWEAWGASDGGYSRKWDGLDFGGGRGLP